MTKRPSENPWVSKAHLETVLARAIDAENCLRLLLEYIDPDVLTRNDFDWKAAVNELVS